VTDLRLLGAAGESDAAGAASRLSDLLYRLANGDTALREKARNALIAPLRLDLDRLRDMLRRNASPVQSVPSELARDWVAPERPRAHRGAARRRPNDTATSRGSPPPYWQLRRTFTGTPVWLIEAEQTVVRAFIEPGPWRFSSSPSCYGSPAGTSETCC